MPRKVDTARRAELAGRALEVLAGRGVHRTTMSDLASELGLKRPTLYFYFRDLEAVFEAVLDDLQARYVGHLHRRLADVVHPIAALEVVLDATIAFHAGRRAQIVVLFQLWAAAGSQDPERVIARGRALVEPLRAALIERIAEGVRRGEVAPCDPAGLVDLTLTVLDGAMVHHVTDGELGDDSDEVAPRARSAIDEYRRRVLTPLMVAPSKPSSNVRKSDESRVAARRARRRT
jgi:AcrR family transcriptional regulator